MLSQADAVIHDRPEYTEGSEAYSMTGGSMSIGFRQVVDAHANEAFGRDSVMEDPPGNQAPPANPLVLRSRSQGPRPRRR